MDKNQSEIKLAVSPEERAAVYRFRYAVYIDEMGKDFPFADHDRRLLKDELDESAQIYCVSSEGEIAATLRLNLLADCPVPALLREGYALDRFSTLAPNQISLTSRLMVAPKFRQSLILGRFLNHVYGVARDAGVRADFCYCAPWLVLLYEYLGYRQYKENFEDPSVGYRIPLVLITEDLRHLLKIGSPFVRAAKTRSNPSDLAEWFAAEFALQGQFIRRAPGDPKKSLQALANHLHVTSVGLFRNLTPEELERFVAASTVIRCAAGDRVVSAGEVGKEMFCILSGIAEVKKRIGKQEYSLVTLGKGQIFGEMAFLSAEPRTAEIVAATDLEVMVLTQEFFLITMAKLPELSAKILFNLAQILCDRLRLSTQNWAEVLDRKKSGAGS